MMARSRFLLIMAGLLSLFACASLPVLEDFQAGPENLAELLAQRQAGQLFEDLGEEGQLYLWADMQAWRSFIQELLPVKQREIRKVVEQGQDLVAVLQPPSSYSEEKTFTAAVFGQWPLARLKFALAFNRNWKRDKNIKTLPCYRNRGSGQDLALGLSRERLLLTSANPTFTGGSPKFPQMLALASADNSLLVWLSEPSSFLAPFVGQSQPVINLFLSRIDQLAIVCEKDEAGQNIFKTYFRFPNAREARASQALLRLALGLFDSENPYLKLLGESDFSVKDQLVIMESRLEDARLKSLLLPLLWLYFPQ